MTQPITLGNIGEEPDEIEILPLTEPETAPAEPVTVPAQEPVTVP